MNIKILYKNNSAKDNSNLLLSAKEWYYNHGVFIDFITENKEAPHIYLEIKDGEMNSGGAGTTNPYGYENQAGGRRSKDNGWYPIHITLGERYKNGFDYGDPTKNLVHEIMHCLHFQFNLGDIHSLPNGANMGNNGNGNEVAMQYFWDNAKLDNKPNKVIVHHTASSTWTYQNVLDFHINKGWLDIGYHYFIEKDGTIKRGRWEEKEGTHTIGQNTTSIGICLAGNFNTELPTKEQEQSFKNILSTLNYKEIKPHRAFAQTDCYGTKLADDWAVNLVSNDMLYVLIKNPNKPSEIYAKKGIAIRHIANMQSLILGSQDPDKLWDLPVDENNKPNLALIPTDSSNNWPTYQESSEIHLDPKD